MNWTKLAENRIEEAIANGEFENLPGHGQPLDLTEYFALPPAERAGIALLKGAKVIPPEVELLRSIAELEKALATTESANRAGKTPAYEKRAAALRQELQDKRVALAMAMERRRRREPRGAE
jgi:hypothetical protein